MSKITVTPEMTELLTDLVVGVASDWLKRRRKTGSTQAVNRSEVRAALLQRLVDSGAVESPDVLDKRGRERASGSV